MQRTAARGDTIVEVILAFALFALLVVSTTYLMNRSLSTGQRSLEMTLVRQQVDSQAELLRFVRDTNHTEWTNIKNAALDASGVSIEASLAACPATHTDIGSSAFVLRAYTSGGVDTVGSTVLDTVSSFAAADYYSRVAMDENKSYGLWITPVRVENSSTDTYDMYIRACWDSVGSDMPQTISTIVRLYDT